jgi:hypothetical protein
VSNENSTITSREFTLIVEVPPVPAITSQPTSYNAIIGFSVVFTVKAKGGEPLTYRWKHNGTLIGAAIDSPVLCAYPLF